MSDNYKKWFKVEFPTLDNYGFGGYINSVIMRKDIKGYYKVFWPKLKAERGFVFYIATESPELIEEIAKKYTISEWLSPDRSKIARIAGFSADRDWMKN